MVLKLPSRIKSELKSSATREVLLPFFYLVTCLTLSLTDLDLAYPYPARTLVSTISYPTKMSKYPCGTCENDVNWSQKGVACDNCNLWFHANCQGIGDQSYNELGENSDVSWICAKCGCLNRSIVSFDLFGVSKETADEHSKNDVSNSPQSRNNQSSENSFLSIESLSPTARFTPTHTSSPKRSSNRTNTLARPLRIINVNFHSAVPKLPITENLIKSLRPDIIIGTETWADKDIADSEMIPPTYNVYRKDRRRDGGGVLIAVHKNLQSSEIPELDTDCEIKWVKVITKENPHLYICACYRNKTSDENGLNNFELSVRRAASYATRMVIGGDLNFPEWDYNTMTLKNRHYVELHERFADILNDLELEQMVKEKTHEINTLDVIMTNTPSMVPRVEVVPGISDHDIVFIEYNVRTKASPKVTRQIPLYGKANWLNMKEDMKKTSTEMSHCMNLSTQSLYDKFEEDLKSTISRNIPQKTISDRGGKSLPWVNSSIKKMIRRRDRLYRKMKKSGQKELKEEIKEIKGKIQKEIRRSYWDYMENLFTEGESQQKVVNKKFWQYVKSRRNSQIGVPPLKRNAVLITDPREKANLLNEQFNSAFSDGKVYTKDEADLRSGDQSRTHPILPDILITEKGVHKILSDLDPSKAPGPDQLSPRVLTELASEIAPILSLIYQKSLSSAEIPHQWKMANVTPVYKKGEHYLPSNYRPISLTSVPCKILEHILVSQIMNHWEVNSILAPEQHGFRSRRSTESQLLNLTENYLSNLDKGIRTDIVVLDFAKAFDKVNHSLLIHKMQNYGIQGSTLNWIENFLSGRTQSVVVDGCQSSPVAVRSGVPQGSVLGPCLFLGYINDLPTQIKSNARLFADDTAIDRPIKSTADERELQEDLDALEQWENKWDMKFHPDKCCVLSVSRKLKKDTPKYQLHGQTLQNVENTKYLGVVLQTDGKWDKQVQSVANKGNKMLGFVKRTVKVASNHIKEQAYKALVRPCLEYATSVWDPHDETHTYKIEKIQRRAARYVTGKYSKTESVTALLKALNWQTLEARRKQQRLVMLFKILNNHIIVDKDHLQPTVQRTRRCHSKQLKRITAGSEYRLQSFFPRSIRDWNSLQDQDVSSDSLNSFKERIRAITQ